MFALDQIADIGTPKSKYSLFEVALLGPVSITAALCVAWRVTIVRHATQRAAVMEMGPYSGGL